MMGLGKRFSTLYFSTIEKEFRSKVFWSILVFTALIILILSWTHGWLNREAKGAIFFLSTDIPKVIFGLLTFWSSILAAVFGVGLIPSDREEGTLPQLLAFPLGRHQYLFARILGGFSLVFSYHLLSTVVSGTWFFGEAAPFGTQLLFSLLTIPSLLWIILRGMIFSLFFNRVLSLVCIFFSGIAQAWAALTVRKVPIGEGGFWSVSAHVIYWLFPHGWVWEEQAMALFPLPGESLDVSWPLELGHFCGSFALFLSPFG